MAENIFVAIAREDGGVSIMTILRADGNSPTAIAEEIEKWQSSSDVAAVGHWPIKEADIPQDLTFRDAWKADGGIISVDMEKARAIHMDRIRRVRNAELAKLDVPYMKAQERGDQAAMTQIAAQKQALRDIPQTFDLNAAQTPDELKALWPTILPKP